MRLESPLVLLLLLCLPALLYLSRREKRSASFLFSSAALVKAAGMSLRQRFGFLPQALRVASFVLLVIALARPQQGQERVQEFSEGVAIEMVVDRSGSMAAEVQYQGERLTRLDVVKAAFEKFVFGDGRKLAGRPNDLVGLVAFARFAETTCPLTLSHEALRAFLKDVQLVTRRDEDGTAIGDALALAAARLKTAEETLARQRDVRGEYTIRSKIIILLTDGQYNYGQRTPLEAAALAAEWGIKIYTIGVGGGQPGAQINTPFGAFVVPGVSQLDEGTLEAVAQKTGGIYRRADDVQSLQAVYEEIDALEKTRIETVKYLDYREWFWPFGLLALLMLVSEATLSATVFRRSP